MFGAAASILLASAAATAQSAAPRFALVSGETVGSGADMVSGKFGWPGAEFGFQHGFSDTADAGVVFDLLYSVEGTTYTAFGIQLGVPLRKVVLRRDRVSLQISITPGLTVYTTTPSAFALNFPVGGVLGIQVLPDLRIGVGADVVMKVRFTPSPVAFEFAPIFGPSIEYYVDKNLSISLDSRFGPFIESTPDAQAQFSFRMQVGVAYRL